MKFNIELPSSSSASRWFVACLLCEIACVAILGAAEVITTESKQDAEMIGDGSKNISNNSDAPAAQPLSLQQVEQQQKQRLRTARRSQDWNPMGAVELSDQQSVVVDSPATNIWLEQVTPSAEQDDAARVDTMSVTYWQEENQATPPQQRPYQQLDRHQQQMALQAQDDEDVDTVGKLNWHEAQLARLHGLGPAEIAALSSWHRLRLHPTQRRLPEEMADSLAKETLPSSSSPLRFRFLSEEAEQKSIADPIGVALDKGRSKMTSTNEMPKEQFISDENAMPLPWSVAAKRAQNNGRSSIDKEEQQQRSSKQNGHNNVNRKEKERMSTPGGEAGGNTAGGSKGNKGKGSLRKQQQLSQSPTTTPLPPLQSLLSSSKQPQQHQHQSQQQQSSKSKQQQPSESMVHRPSLAMGSSGSGETESRSSGSRIGGPYATGRIIDAGGPSPVADGVSRMNRNLATQFLLRSPRENRQYDVPIIECPPAEDGMERFACPSPDLMGRYRCIDDHVLCDGFIDCPGGEDEHGQACMFYKTMKAHLDLVADALLRWVRGR